MNKKERKKSSYTGTNSVWVLLITGLVLEVFEIVGFVILDFEVSVWRDRMFCGAQCSRQAALFQLTFSCDGLDFDFPSVKPISKKMRRFK
jgi:hypothetical protein